MIGRGTSTALTSNSRARVRFDERKGGRENEAADVTHKRVAPSEIAGKGESAKKKERPCRNWGPVGLCEQIKRQG